MSEIYERGDAKVVFGQNGTYSLWDASVRLGAYPPKP